MPLMKSMAYLEAFCLLSKYLEIFQRLLGYSFLIWVREHTLYGLDPINCINMCFLGQNIIYLDEYSMYT